MNLLRFMDISIFWDEVSAWQYARLLEDACVLLKIASRSLHVERRTNNLNFSITSLIDLSYCLFYLVRTVGHCNYSPNFVCKSLRDVERVENWRCRHSIASPLSFAGEISTPVPFTILSRRWRSTNSRLRDVWCRLMARRSTRTWNRSIATQPINLFLS